MAVGKIYALYYKNNVIYIGKTPFENNLEKRLKEFFHNSFACQYQTKIYSFIRDVTTSKTFYTDITIKLIKEVELIELDYYHEKAIKYALSKGARLYNTDTHIPDGFTI